MGMAWVLWMWRGFCGCAVGAMMLAMALDTRTLGDIEREEGEVAEEDTESMEEGELDGTDLL